MDRYRLAPPANGKALSSRGLSMRARIIDATIDLLGKQGYAATTIKAIATATGCSVGALQHQFPSKDLLMAGVLDELLANRIAGYRRTLADTPIERGIDVMVTGTWNIVRCPGFLAMVEIALARRSDEELRRATERSFAYAERLLERWTMRLWRRYGVDPQVAASARRLHGALLTGIAIRVASGVERDAESVIRTWERLIRCFADHPELCDILVEKP